jgi:6-phosphogluconolactonase
MATRADLQIFEDRPAMARAAARQVISLAQNAIEAHNVFRIALSGGSTPRMLHEILSQPAHSAQVNWAKTQIFWGDERCVPPSNPESNYRMAVETLLEHIPLPAGHIHRVRGELPPQEAASDYQQRMVEQFRLIPDETGKPFPRFDLILLGLGPDGHTASLFPGSKALEEIHRWVTWLPHEQGPEPLVPRVTITLPVIQAARQVIFLVSGEDKAARLAEVLSPPTGQPLPAQLANPTEGGLLWMVDRAAASRLG